MKSFWLLPSPFFLFKEHSTCFCNERNLDILKNKAFYHPINCALDAILADATGPVFQHCQCVHCRERHDVRTTKETVRKSFCDPMSQSLFPVI